MTGQRQRKKSRSLKTWRSIKRNMSADLYILVIQNRMEVGEEWRYRCRRDKIGMWVFHGFLYVGVYNISYILYLTSYILHLPGSLKHPRLPSSASCRTQWRVKPRGWVCRDKINLPYNISCKLVKPPTKEHPRQILSSPNLSSTQFIVHASCIIPIDRWVEV